MQHLKRCLTLGLVLLGLALTHTDQVKGVNVTGTAKLVSTGASTKVLVKNGAKDAYAALIRDGLMPTLSKGFRQMKLEFSSSPFYSLARTWHAYFFHFIKKSKIPQKWTELAAGIYEKLGGKGDLVETMAGFTGPGTGFNVSLRGPLREEFISYAYFFLKTFVPETIEQCLEQEPDQAVECIAQYEESLQAALLSTLSAYFHYISSRAPSPRIPSTAFVLSAVTPCPFGFLTEPTFVYGGMTDSKNELLRPLASLRRALTAEKCPSLKKALLRVLMTTGVTFQDFMAKQDLEKDLVKFNVDQVLEEETKELEKIATAFDKDSLRKDDAPKDARRVETSDDLISVLGEVYSADAEKAMERLMETPLGESLKSMLEALDSPQGVAYRQRVEAFVEGQQKEDMNLDGFLFDEIAKGLAKEIEEEARDNPPPLKQKEAESLQDESEKVLQLVRRFNLRASPLYPKPEGKKDEKEKEKEKGKK